MCIYPKGPQRVVQIKDNHFWENAIREGGGGTNAGSRASRGGLAGFLNHCGDCLSRFEYIPFGEMKERMVQKHRMFFM